MDAFSTGLLGEEDRSVAIIEGQIFKWDKIYLNVQNSYNPETGQYKNYQSINILAFKTQLDCSQNHYNISKI